MPLHWVFLHLVLAALWLFLKKRPHSHSESVACMALIWFSKGGLVYWTHFLQLLRVLKRFFKLDQQYWTVVSVALTTLNYSDQSYYKSEQRCFFNNIPQISTLVTEDSQLLHEHAKFFSVEPSNEVQHRRTRRLAIILAEQTFAAKKRLPHCRPWILTALPESLLF